MSDHRVAAPISSEAIYIKPWQRSVHELCIPAPIFCAVFKHLRVYFQRAGHKPPRFLAIQGPAGDGKTEMTALLCSHFGCNTFCLSGAALSGKHEGDAQRVLRRALEDATNAAFNTQRPSVLILDDIDRGVMSLNDRTGHTVNSQLLVGALQEMANDAEFNGTNPYLRVPVVLTGNNFLCLPQTLLRPGRTRFFSWEPSWEEKAAMVMPLLPRLTGYQTDRLKRLVRRYHAKGEPVAFFIDVINIYKEPVITISYDDRDILQCAALADEVAEKENGKVDLDRIEQLADQLHRNKARSYVGQERGVHVLP